MLLSSSTFGTAPHPNLASVRRRAASQGSVVINLSLRKGKTTHVKTFFAIPLTLGLLAASAFAQPTVTQVSNGASFSLTPLQNASIAQGAFFSIFGKNFGPASSTCGANFAACAWGSSYPLPTSIQGTSVSVTSGGQSFAPYISFAVDFGSYSQINAVLPSNTPAGPATLTVTTGGTASASFPVTVTAATFGTFAINQGGTGPGVIFDAQSNILTPFHTAKPGDVVVLWGTGLGPVLDASTENLAPKRNPDGSLVDVCPQAFPCPSVWVAGKQASVQYAGRSGFTAIDQINFVVPQDVEGCYVQVAVQTGTGANAVVGNFTSMTVDSSGGTCKDADGIDYSDIAAKVQSTGKVNVGDMILLSNYLNLNTALGNLQWANDTVSGEIGTFTPGVLGLFQGFTLAPSVNNCSVSPFLKYPPPVDPGLSMVTYLDAGASLSIQSPSGSPVTVPKNTNNKGYGGLVGGETINQLVLGCTASNGCPPFFLNATGWGTSSWTYGIMPGAFTVTGPGGADVGALSAAVSVSNDAASFKWTNQASVTANPIPRNTPLTITWTGGDPNGFVNITAISSTLQSGQFPLDTTPGILAECVANTADGTFTIPTYVLQALPSNVGSQAVVPPGELLVGPASGAVKATPPAGLDELYIFYHFIAGQNVTWQ